MIPVRAYWKLLSRYVRPLRGRVAVLAALLFTGIAFQAINPQLIKRFIDRVGEGADITELLSLAAGFTILAVSYQALNVAATYFAEHIGWTATNEMRAHLADHCLRLDLGFHKRVTPGELIERIDGDVTALSNFFSKLVIQVFGNIVLIVVVLILLWRENVWVGAGLTGFAGLALASMLIVQHIAIPWWKAVSKRKAEFFGQIGEQLGGTEDIKANGGVPFMLRRFSQVLRGWRPEAVRARHGFSTMWGISITTYVFGTALVFWLGSTLVGSGTITVGSVYLIFHYTDMIRHPMEQIRTQLEDMQKAGAGIARIEDLFANYPLMAQDGTRPLPSGPLAVELDEVSFAYDDDAANGETVLEGIDLALAPGTVLGLLGRTGGGKSTMARLLTRLYDPVEGTIRLGGEPLPEVDPADLRRRVGMVTQEVQLFRASLRDNLTFFDHSIPDDRLLAVLADLGMLDWMATLPAGLDSMLESGAGGLSAGQAQLLAFARIFLRDPGLVILDEASSRLDPATETLIERAVDKLLANRTGVIIAHRLATVQRADQILILDHGRVIEFGDRATLASDPQSRLAHLLRTGIEEVLA